MTEAQVAAHAEEANNIQCNKCVYVREGHAVLKQQLSVFMKARLTTELRAALGVLSGGWHNLKYTAGSGIKPRHENRIKQLIASLEAAEGKFKKIKLNEGWSELDVEADDIEDNLAVMKWRRLEWLQISVEEEDLARACVDRWGSFGVWQDSWDEAIGYWRWAKAWADEVSREPEKVVWWALERDSKRLNS